MSECELNNEFYNLKSGTYSFYSVTYKPYYAYCMFVLAHRMLMNWGKEEAWNAIIREAEIKPKYIFQRHSKLR